MNFSTLCDAMCLQHLVCGVFLTCKMYSHFFVIATFIRDMGDTLCRLRVRRYIFSTLDDIF